MGQGISATDMHVWRKSKRDSILPACYAFLSLCRERITVLGEEGFFPDHRLRSRMLRD